MRIAQIFLIELLIASALFLSLLLVISLMRTEIEKIDTVRILAEDLSQALCVSNPNDTEVLFVINRTFPTNVEVVVRWNGKIIVRRGMGSRIVKKLVLPTCNGTIEVIVFE